MDDEVEGFTQVLCLVSGLNLEFKEIEHNREDIAHFLYTLKIINDLNLQNRPTLSKPEYLQKEIFDTTLDIFHITSYQN